MNKDKVAERLKSLRGDRPREEVALACGITSNAVQMYETGKRIPSDTIKVRLAKYFGKTVQSIFFDD